ncbi:hypothetical protein HJC23_012020 [Cyclotella cryptica]|uniref:DUF6824 domain-containing protein n=1 Tax=Cyclotella cryptica TaxID=29204 RepID=A0ABD3QS45_9STRA|eukprot:CCRYP_003081-RB/>CCRYP_003081-RB protein AED:0.22 eAED:0.22 QI:2166/1/0.8/1/0.5/0.4/5/0/259
MANNIIRPHENDILLGRGGHNYQHSGNEQLREIARSRVNDYSRATKKGKAAISREILKQVEGMDPPGRFLRKDSVTNTFVEVRKSEAREKVCQTLRDAVSERREVEGPAAANGSAGIANTEGEANDEEDEEGDIPLPPLPYKECPENHPMRHELFDYNSFPFEILPVDSILSSAESSISGIATSSPHKNSPNTINAPATVTPTNQTIETSPSFIFSGCEMEHDAYNYLSRVGVNDDFDLFDGDLLRSAMHDEVFASLRL